MDHMIKQKLGKLVFHNGKLQGLKSFGSFGYLQFEVFIQLRKTLYQNYLVFNIFADKIAILVRD